jgi:hypothetical protein
MCSAITNDIITDILEYRIKSITKNFDVYARDGYLESKVYGNIDLFVETYPDEYKMVCITSKMIQRKIIKYNTLRDTSDGHFQWINYHLEEILVVHHTFIIQWS